MKWSCRTNHKGEGGFAQRGRPMKSTRFKCVQRTRESVLNGMREELVQRMERILCRLARAPALQNDLCEGEKGITLGHCRYQPPLAKHQEPWAVCALHYQPEWP